MTSSLAFLILLAPALFVLPDLLAPFHPGTRPRRLIRWSIALSAIGLAVSLAGLVHALAIGPLVSPLIGLGEVGIAVRIDVLSMTMASLVSFIGLVVFRFSANYLDGDPRQAVFYGALGSTVALVLMLVISNNLVQLVAAFVAMSLAFNRLLVFYPDRPAARLVARKKFVVARLADASLIIAATLFYLAFGTADITAIMAAAGTVTTGSSAWMASLGAVFLALAAMQKSAQFPFHFWLPEVMETPTPVSALLHAGIINAGGFLVLRFADVMVGTPFALHLLAAFGAGTALVAGLVMITQTTAKGSLAWSTIAQMGFMLLQCGLGLFALALFHILAHSLYKAHAFLSAGSVLATPAARPAQAPQSVKSLTGDMVTVMAGLALAAILYAAIAMAFGLDRNKDPALLAMGAILVLSAAHFVGQALAGRPGPLRFALATISAGLIVTVYLGLQLAAGVVFGAGLPPVPAADAASLTIMVLAVAGFTLSLLWQSAGPALSGHPLARAARIHLANGLYINHLANRLLAARPVAAASQS